MTIVDKFVESTRSLPLLYNFLSNLDLSRILARSNCPSLPSPLPSPSPLTSPYHPYPPSPLPPMIRFEPTTRGRDRVKENRRTGDSFFNDSEVFFEWRPPFRLASTFSRRTVKILPLSLRLVHEAYTTDSVAPPQSGGNVRPRETATPARPSPATSLLTVQEMFILPFCRPLQKRFLDLRNPPKSTTLPP